MCQSHLPDATYFLNMLRRWISGCLAPCKALLERVLSLFLGVFLSLSSSWKLWWRNWGTVLCAQCGRSVAGRGAAGLGTECPPRHMTGLSWGDKDGNQEQLFIYCLSAQLPQPLSISLALILRGESCEPATVHAAGRHPSSVGDISSVRGWPGLCMAGLPFPGSVWLVV